MCSRRCSNDVFAVVPAKGSEDSDVGTAASRWPIMQKLVVSLGMRQDAFTDYFALHENPVVPLLEINASNLLNLGLFLVLSSGLPFQSSGFALVTLAGIMFVQSCAFWHYGPYGAERKPLAILVVVYVLGDLGATAMNQAGPLRFVPFQNRLTSTLIIAFTVFLESLTVATGATPHTRPQEHMRGIVRLVIPAFTTTVRVIHVVTDISIFRVLLAEVLAPAPCWLHALHQAQGCQQVVRMHTAFDIRAHSWFPTGCPYACSGCTAATGSERWDTALFTRA
jgi:hypothetical protein